MLDCYITRSPLRISFAGGGTDFPNYFREFGGIFVSSSINRYVYCTVKKHSSSFRENIRLNYSQTELHTSINQIGNEIVRAALQIYYPEATNEIPRLYIGTIGDLRSGSGLGSSSAFTCALLFALTKMKGQSISTEELAQKAVELEIDILGKPIGIQDQYASSFGGLRSYEIDKVGKVNSKTIALSKLKQDHLGKAITLVDTGIGRKAETVLKHQFNPDSLQLKSLHKIQNAASSFVEGLEMCSDSNIVNYLGNFLDENWNLKKQVSKFIANHDLQDLYSRLIDLGYLGGKLSGAGGGGYFLMISEIGERERLAIEIVNKLGLTIDLPDLTTTGTELIAKC